MSYRSYGIKDEMLYSDLVREDAKFNLKRAWAEIVREHAVEGCPLEKGAAGCAVCEVPAWLPNPLARSI